MKKIVTLVGAAAVAVGMSLTAVAAKKAHRIAPGMPTSQTQQVASPSLAGFRCYTNNPSCSGNARFGGSEAMSFRILYNQGKGGQKNFTTDPGQIVSEPVRFNDIYQYAPRHVVIPNNAPSWFIGVD